MKTKRCNTKPKDYYDCSIAAHGTKQDCDSYIFVRITTNMDRAWILGEVDKKTFYKDAEFHRRGDIDPDNGFVFKADCYNLPINKLSPIYEASG